MLLLPLFLPEIYTLGQRDEYFYDDRLLEYMIRVLIQSRNQSIIRLLFNPVRREALVDALNLYASAQQTAHMSYGQLCVFAVKNGCVLRLLDAFSPGHGLTQEEVAQLFTQTPFVYARPLYMEPITRPGDDDESIVDTQMLHDAISKLPKTTLTTGLARKIVEISESEANETP